MQIYTDWEAEKLIREIRARDPEYNFAQLFKRMLLIESNAENTKDAITRRKIILLKEMHDYEKKALEIKKEIDLIESQLKERDDKVEEIRKTEEKEIKEMLIDWYGFNLEEIKKIIEEYFSDWTNTQGKNRRLFIEKQAEKYGKKFIPKHLRGKDG